MKKYSEYFEEINENELFEGLLSEGLFADKIPDFLTGTNFYDYCKTITKGYQDKEYDYVRYNTIRNTNSIRHLAIPNPFAYYNVCKYLVSYRNEICRHFEETTKNQKIKRSLIHIQKLKGKKSLFEMSKSYEDKDKFLEKEITKLPIKKRFKVEADISNCFPSIYSHVLAWALVGKSEAKKHKGDTTLWYNKLDAYCRHMKYGETNGLLIGPHTSNLLSEIVLSCIDNQLSSKYDYYRNIDDFTCYVKDEAEAEQFLLDLTNALKEYELTLNTKKTKITNLPTTTNDDWVYSLNCFFVGNEKTEDGKVIFNYQRLKAFLDIVVQKANDAKNLSVYSYAMKIICGKYFGKKAKEYYKNFIHQIALLYPYVLHFVEKCVFEEFNVTKNEIKEISLDIYEFYFTKDLIEPCSYALYWSIKYDFTPPTSYVNDAIQSKDCIHLLLAYIKAKQDKNTDGITKLKAEAESLKDDIEAFWLFVYEVLPNTKLEGDFKRIKKANVSFLKSEFLDIVKKK